jgi:hypothetical protein
MMKLAVQRAKNAYRVSCQVVRDVSPFLQAAIGVSSGKNVCYEHRPLGLRACLGGAALARAASSSLDSLS